MKISARPKITVIGGGNVGATTAMRLAEARLGDVVLVDIVEGMPQGKCLDLFQSAPVVGHDCRLVGSNGYDETAGSDIVVMTAGLARKPGMSRDDLLKANAEIVRAAMKGVVPGSPGAIIIMVTNPLDAMAQLAMVESKFPRERVLGMAGVLDSARFSAFIAQELNVSVTNIQAFVLGGHGDDMVPLTRYTTVAGVPVTELIKPERLAQIVDRTRKGGAEIVALLKTGSAYYAPSASAVQMCDAILNDRKQILPCSAYLQGEYGHRGVFLGVPCKLGRKGLDSIFEVELRPEEKEALGRSAKSVEDLVKVLGLM
jgi:malate dehydrogenase